MYCYWKLRFFGKISKIADNPNFFPINVFSFTLAFGEMKKIEVLMFNFT